MMNLLRWIKNLLPQKNLSTNITKEKLQLFADLLAEHEKAHELLKRYRVSSPNDKPIIYKPPKYL